MKVVAWTIVLLLAASVAVLGGEPPGAIDPNFRATLAPGEIPIDVCRTADGTLYVLVDHPPGPREEHSLVIRFFPDGTRDSSFRTDPQGGNDLQPYGYRSLKADPAGRIYLEGYQNQPEPSTAEGRPRDGIKGPLTLLRSDGSIDPSYGRTDVFDRILHSYHPTDQGAVWAVGRLAGREGQSLVRLGTDGLILTNAGVIHAPAGAWFNVNSVIERTGNRLLLVGQIAWPRLSPTIGLVQFGPNARIDPDFQPPAEGFDRGFLANLWNAALDHHDCILVAGLFRQAGQHFTTNVARLKPNGVVDTTFRAGPMDGSAERIWEDDAGRLLIAGAFTRIQEVPRPGLARLQSNGALDATFTPELPKGTHINRAIDGGSSSVVVAGYQNVGFERVPVLLRLLPGDSSPVIPEIVHQPDGVRRRVGGDHAFSPLLRVPPGARLQWLHNGEPIPGATNAYQRFPRLRMEHNGTYQLVVTAPSGSATTRPVSVVVEPAAATPGAPDMSVDFNGGPSFNVYGLRLLADGRLLVGGEFQRIGTNKTGTLAVLTADGQLDADATRRITVRGTIAALLPDEDGILVMGSFREIGDHPTRSLGRLNADGTIDRRVQSRILPPSTIRSAARLADGSFLVSGTLFKGPDRQFDYVPLARLQENGEFDFSFAEALDVSASIYHASNLGDGRIVFAGWSQPKGPQGFLRFLNRDGSASPNSVDFALTPTTGRMLQLWTVPRGTDGLLVAGDFTVTDPAGVRCRRIAEFRAGSLQRPEILGAPLNGHIADQCGTLDPEGRLLTAGLRLTRWANGKADPTFRASVDGDILCIVADARGDLYVGGTFRKIGDVVRPHLAKILGSNRSEPYILGPFRTERGLALQFETNEGWNYEIETSADAASGPWAATTSFQGDGKVHTVETDPGPEMHQFYRIRARP